MPYQKQSILLRKPFLWVALLACAVLLVSCGSAKRPQEVESTVLQFNTPQNGDTIAIIETNKGTIKIVLYPTLAPVAVDNFIRLSENGYYENTTFHRIVKDFIIQGGDPTGTGSGGMSVWGGYFDVEISGQLHNYSGAVGMASTSNGNGSQFYIVQTPTDSVSDVMAEQLLSAGYTQDVVDTYLQVGGVPYLDNGYTIFGQVYEGMDVVDKMASVSTDDREKPKKDIVVQSITISTYDDGTTSVSSEET